MPNPLAAENVHATHGRGIYLINQLMDEVSFERNGAEIRMRFYSRLTASHIVKYYRCVHIVTRKHLREAIESHPDAANEIKAWTAVVEAARWHNIEEVRRIFKDADPVDGYVVFNIRHNR